MILEAVATNPNYLNATHCTLKMITGFNSSMPPHRSVQCFCLVCDSSSSGCLVYDSAVMVHDLAHYRYGSLVHCFAGLLVHWFTCGSQVLLVWFVTRLIACLDLQKAVICLFRLTAPLVHLFGLTCLPGRGLMSRWSYLDPSCSFWCRGGLTWTLPVH